MHFFDVMYYYYYVFYSSIYKETEPELTAKLSLAASESFLAIAVSSIVSAYFFCYKFGRPECIVIIVVILIINFSFILTSKREKEILVHQPTLFKSNTASVIIAWLFFIFTASILFWLNSVVNLMIDNCR